MKAISFIGTGTYRLCNYSYNKTNGAGSADVQLCETHLFPIAIAEFFKPDEMIICLTDEAKDAKPKFYGNAGKSALDEESEYYDELEKVFDLDLSDKTYIEQIEAIAEKRGLVKPTKVDIKSGKDEDELWEIFDVISKCVEENDEIVVDITHAFRSIPLLSFLVIAYLRETKNITLNSLIYGAFEARDSGNNTAPIFDLTELVKLFDWISAAKQFNEAGSAKFLVDVLRSNNDINLADKIENISQSLRLLRPDRIMESAINASNTFNNEKAKKHWKSKPVFELMESIDATYSQWKLANPKSADSRCAFVKKLFELSHWYFDNGQYLQSIAMLRELIVTIVCIRLEKDFFKLDANRRIAESYLNDKPNRNKEDDAKTK
ncbi:MAG: TIGR02221 family CRISPR-associated protein, partial [Pyrinomonadaceae bacterium]